MATNRIGRKRVYHNYTVPITVVDGDLEREEVLTIYALTKRSALRGGDKANQAQSSEQLFHCSEYPAYIPYLRRSLC